MNYNKIAKKIIELRDADLELRNKLIQEGKLNKGYNEDMEKLHLKNTSILDDLINRIGYPTIDKVGKEASEAAWLIIQHSIGNPKFMKKGLKFLEIATSENKVDPKNLAYLTDRIASFEGKPQLYGTQFDWDKNGELSPNFYDDLVKLNQRRKSVGLNSLEEQILFMRQRAKNENSLPPIDFVKRQKEMNEWRKKVGWIE